LATCRSVRCRWTLNTQHLRSQSFLSCCSHCAAKPFARGAWRNQAFEYKEPQCLITGKKWPVRECSRVVQRLSDGSPDIGSQMVASHEIRLARRGERELSHPAICTRVSAALFHPAVCTCISLLLEICHVSFTSDDPSSTKRHERFANGYSHLSDAHDNPP
jgi:hypothetical protein